MQTIQKAKMLVTGPELKVVNLLKTRSALYMKINIHALIIMVVWHVHWLVRRLKKAPTYTYNYT